MTRHRLRDALGYTLLLALVLWCLAGAVMVAVNGWTR